MNPTQTRPPRVVTLSPAQAAVVRHLVSDGCDNVTIGRRLGISRERVNDHLRQAYMRSGCVNRTELALEIARGEIVVRVMDRRRVA